MATKRATAAIISMALACSVVLVGTPVVAGVALPPFYEAAAKLKAEGKLGQIVKREPVATGLPGARAWRIVYISSDALERKTLASALVVAPVGPAPKQGRPVIAWAHGTTGTAQNCGPSQVFDPAQPLNQYFLVGGNSWTDYGLPSVDAFIKQGYVVVGTDYQGLGAGGKHQYAVSASNGRDVINSVRAASSMKETGGGGKAIVYGWSQGGGATLAAASLAGYIAQNGTAADGIAFLGFVALAPHEIAAMAPKGTLDAAGAAKMLEELVTNFSDNVFNFSHFAMLLWGTQAAYPDTRLTDIFTDEGAATFDKIASQKCMHPTSDTLNYTFGANFKTLLKPEVTNALAWSKAFVDGSVPPVKPVAPVIIYWGTADTVVPPVMGQLYRKQMCGLGANVTRVQLDGKQTHFSTPGAAAPLYLPWIADRFADRPIADGCTVP
ncbi:alpha/beta fold hydrolase [Methylocapsa palsarum]|uniref:Secretory lipase n=1 Tax=Methylocapsa palsarum TaxID=1612308 RepID=A0A1I3XZ97_9HYPH|nr:alpha/beta fold hydrolase [Methylocapsa palsarum]SFK24875.1 Secretory lipase [Methylocapsa palsarum]